MPEGAGDGSGPATGVRPGALTALLQEVAATPEQSEAEPASLPPGTVIGRFEILRELGRGGFGVVYEARDRDLGRQVAVKVVRPGRIVEEEGRVTREAEAISRLLHPNLVTLFDVGTSDAGPYLVFELLRGKTLDLRIEEGPLPVQEAVHVATEVARGLAHAHAEGVIHRDLKPANVFVTNKGQVKILDFGMAHAFGRRRLSGGTPAYMAPEQWEDAPEDERTDVFALGVMLYRMLTGEYPFPEGQGRWSAEPAPVRKLDVPGTPELAELVERMLDRNPTARLRDGAAVLAALTPIEDRIRAKPADGAPPAHAKQRKATFGDLLAELKRRHVFRVMVGYGIFAFAVLQVTEPIMHGADLPNWVLKAVLVGLVLGFPVAVILAWIFDLTAQGVKRTPSATGPGANLSGRGRFLLPLAVSAAVLAIAAGGAGAWYAWKRTSEHRSAVAAGGAASIAVLPFKDLSPNHDQENFADGLAEEILSALAQIHELKVIGRTSSFSFKGKADDLKTIGQKLNAGSILEGSVRKDGSRLRITARLTRSEDGTHLWAQTFERDQAGVFAVQEEIARDVVDALRVKVLTGKTPTTKWTRTSNPEVYNQYLLGHGFRARGSLEGNRRALLAYEKALALDPSYAPAWAGVSAAIGNIDAMSNEPPDPKNRQRASEAAERAIALAPDLAEGYHSRALVRSASDPAGALADEERALSLKSNYAWAEAIRASLLSSLGRQTEALAAARRATELEPLDAWAWFYLGVVYVRSNELDRGTEALTRALEISPEHGPAQSWLVQTLVRAGRPGDALAAARRTRSEPERLFVEALAQHDLGNATESQAALDALTAKHAGEYAYQIAEVHGWRGERDRAFDWLERAHVQRDPGLQGAGGDPFLGRLHGDSRWRPFLKKMNLPADGEQATARPAEANAPPSIAVLPFADMSPKHDQEYFADGVAEEIRNALAHVDGLKVIGRSSSFSFKGKSDDLKSIGQKLGVANVLEGSLRKDGNGIRITAQLIRVADGTHIWSEAYDRKLSGVFTVQDDIAKAVVGALKVKLLPTASAGAAPPGTNPDAYLQVLLGRQVLDRAGKDSQRRATEAFERAVALDSRYAPAWAGLATAHYMRFQLSQERADLEKGEVAAGKAVALDPASSAGYEARSLLRLARWDWEGARADANRAVAIDSSSPTARRRRSLVLRIVTGDPAQGFEDLHLSMELDPLSAQGWAQIGLRHRLLRQPERARPAFQRALEISPGWTTPALELAILEIQAGNVQEARRLIASADGTVSPFWSGVLDHASGNEPGARAALAEVTREWGATKPKGVADIHAWLGENDLAFQWLDRALEQRDPMLRYARDSFWLESLHSDPRWKAMLRKMNLPVD